MIKLKTRLSGNGHEWKVRVGKTDPFKNLKMKFSDVYGVELKYLSFKFDGEPIADDDTTKSLDMEDDNLIDVRFTTVLI